MRVGPHDEHREVVARGHAAEALHAVLQQAGQPLGVDPGLPLQQREQRVVAELDVAVALLGDAVG